MNIYRVGKKSITLPLEEKGGDVEKPPKGFQYGSDNVFVPFVQKQESFNEEVRTFMDAILECPTIKKEIDSKFLNKYK